MDLPSNLEAREVTLGEGDKAVRFFIDEMPFDPAAEAFENAKFQLGEAGVVTAFDRVNLAAATSGVVDASDGKVAMSPEAAEEAKKALVGVLDALVRMKPAVMLDIRARQFAHIRYQRGADTPRKLKGLEADAFRGPKIHWSYELLIRSLAVNFLESLSAGLSGFDHVRRLIGSL